MIGCQTPRILSVPWRRYAGTGRWDGAEDREALDFTSPSGQECIDLAEDAGLHLDPWQQLALHHSLVEDDEGRWLSLDVVLNVARQNGKGGFLEARQLGEVILFGGRLVIHTAHQFNTAQESFLRLDQVIEGSYSLSRRVKRVRRSHGEEGFEFFNGARIRFLARGGDSGRGFSGDLVLMDEAMKLRAAPIGALMPVLSARPNPQLVYTGSAGLGQESEQLALLRARALVEGESPDPSLCYLEHSIAPHVKECPTDAEGCIVCELHDDRGDERSFARANPALGIRIRTAYVLQEMRSMRPDLFDRERLGDGDYPEVTDETWQVIPKAKWEACEDVKSKPGDPVAFAIDTNPERTWTAISVVGASGDGVHAEVVAHRPGTDWVVDYVVERDQKWNPCAWVVDEGGPAGSLVPAIRKALAYEDDPEREDRSEFLRCPKVREVTQACGMFYDHVMDTGTLYHLGQAPMTAALAGARKRDIGDAWAWSRKSEGVDISPLVASTNALWGWAMYHDVEPEEAEPWGFYG
ncbi:terminase [Streptomyces sp. ID05-04B]|uniref:terminase n=1 Tax=unclassified Streptomyces TaxID=2593676 RepID=UPI000D19E066|nr:MULTISPECIES: terminase [unclassified Streptomyces]AVV46454.1 terminase [Streptomyces sp. P3]AVV46513.1 terminase [Streptomyces sp. P3]MDX5570396.1 terminase [Streptomyces sp. ID05-04B]